MQNQQSPSMQKVMGFNQPTVNSKPPHNYDVHQFNKKHPNHVNQHSAAKFGSGTTLNPVESSHSFKTSPVKPDQHPQQKTFIHGVNIPSSNKAQKIKVGNHKKAVSLLNRNLNSIDQVDQNHPHHDNFTANSILNQISKQNESQKQSGVPSSQTSFYDYMTNNGGYPSELRQLAKPMNIGLQDKSGSLLTHQQKQMLSANYQQLMQDHAQPKPQKQKFKTNHMVSTFSHTNNTSDVKPKPNQIGFKSFDNRTGVSNSTNNQSQRQSLVTSTVISDNQNQNVPASRKGQRSHTNSFASKNQGPYYNHHQKNPSLPGGVIAPEYLIKKKTLQAHHQRTFSDSQGNPGMNIMMGHGINKPPVKGSYQQNRQLQEILNIVGNEGEPNDPQYMMAVQNEQYKNFQGQNIAFNQTHFQQTKSNTLQSSRQSAHSSNKLDDIPIQLSVKKDSNKQEKYSDLKTIYNGMFKDQLQKTKQVLKLTQQQFGGPSRKVVQSSSKLNANTQSYRATNYGPLQNVIVNTIGEKYENKSTPKIGNQQQKITTLKGSKIKSQNVSSHGTRVAQSTNMGSMNLLEKQQKKKKNINNFLLNQMNYNQNISGNQVFNGSANATSNDTFRQGGNSKTSSQGQGGHKRSISDGNSAFISLSNRVPHQFGNGSLSAHVTQEISSNQPGTVSSGSVELSKQNSKKISHKKMPSQQNITPYTQGASLKQSSIPQSERQTMNNNSISTPETINFGKAQVIQHPEKMVAARELAQKKIDKYSQPIEVSNPKQVSDLQVKLVKKKDMVIQDQSQSSQTPSNNNSLLIKKGPQMHFQHAPINPKPSTGQLQPLNLKSVDERIETQESVGSDLNVSPRTKMILKLTKKVKLAFQTTGSAPATGAEFYKIGKVMGKGAFGKVNLAIHRLSEKFVALKSINKSALQEESQKKKVMQEFNILRRTRHRNIVRLYESFETQQHIVFVMEICGAGDLLTYVRRRRKLKEDVAKHLFKQIIEGLKYCHSKNILHRDIKLDNILLSSEGDVKICDFGVSKIVRNGEIMTEQCGTPAYISPEVFENKGYEGYASDIWSAGVVLYAMLYGTVPFKASNMTELQKQITRVQTSFKEEISSEAISLLKGILERDPLKRLSCNQILAHPWMADLNDKIIVFTDQEKEKTYSEFAYYNLKNDANNGNEVIATDPFTEQMLNSTQNSLMKNASTKSVILAPFNSTRTHIEENVHLRQSIQELMIDKKNIKFAAKVKEIDRQYEQNNNAELDNGVYHQDDEEEEKKEEEQKKEKKGSLMTSFDKIDNDELEDDQKLQKEIEDEQNRKKQSEWQKLEQQVMDNVKTDEEEEEKQNFCLTNETGTTQTLVLNDQFISEVEKCGFPKPYIVNSLNNDELNYATTFYYLLGINKEY